MKNKFRPTKKPNEALPSLNTAINALDLARDNATLKPVRDAFRSTSTLLVTTRVSFLPTHVCWLFADVRRTR